MGSTSMLHILYPILIAIFVAYGFYGSYWKDKSNRIEASANTRELHTDILYLNFPLEPKKARTLLSDPLKFAKKKSFKPDLYDGRAWVSVAIDYAEFDFWVPYYGFTRFPVSGHQHKVNLLVHDERRNQKGYLILSIHFDNSFAGYLKSFGAKLTQGLDASTVTYQNFTGDKSFMVSCSLGSKPFRFKGDFAKETHDKKFASFVIDRPVKYLKDNREGYLYSEMIPTKADLNAYSMSSYNDAETRALDKVTVSGNIFSGSSLEQLFSSVPWKDVRFFWSSRLLLVNHENRRV